MNVGEERRMTEWVSCPKCGALMIGLTGSHICPLCGYRLPVQTITYTTGTEKYGEYVEVIRCKDCKYYTGKWCTKFSTKQFDINDICKDNNDFCSMAERKEECSR